MERIIVNLEPFELDLIKETCGGEDNSVPPAALTRVFAFWFGEEIAAQLEPWDRVAFVRLCFFPIQDRIQRMKEIPA